MDSQPPPSLRDILKFLTAMETVWIKILNYGPVKEILDTMDLNTTEQASLKRVLASAETKIVATELLVLRLCGESAPSLSELTRVVWGIKSRRDKEFDKHRMNLTRSVTALKFFGLAETSKKKGGRDVTAEATDALAEFAMALNPVLTKLATEFLQRRSDNEGDSE